MPASGDSKPGHGAAATRSCSPATDSKPIVSPSASATPGTAKLSPVELMVSGLASGLLTKTVCAPMDRLRLLFQVQGMMLHQQERETARRAAFGEGPGERRMSGDLRPVAPSRSTACSSRQCNVPAQSPLPSSPTSSLSPQSSAPPSFCPPSRPLLSAPGATNAKYAGILSSLRVVVREEGVLGLWRGNGANTCRAAVAYAIKFPTNDWACSLLQGLQLSPLRGELRSMSCPNDGSGERPSKQLGVWDLMLAGSMAGVLQKAVCYPLDLVSVRIAMGVNTAAVAGYAAGHSPTRRPSRARPRFATVHRTEAAVSAGNVVDSTTAPNTSSNTVTRSAPSAASPPSCPSSTGPARCTSLSKKKFGTRPECHPAADIAGIETSLSDREKHLKGFHDKSNTAPSPLMTETRPRKSANGCRAAYADRPCFSSRTALQCLPLHHGMLKFSALRSTTAQKPAADGIRESRQLYSGLWDCVHRIFMTEGVSGFYKGFGVALWSGVPYVMLQMTLYELWKRQFAAVFGVSASAGEEGRRTDQVSSSWLRKVMGSSTAGSLANFTAQLIVFPFDTVRKRLMADGIDGREKLYSSCRACLASIYHREGIVALYSGLGPATLRCLPAGAVQFTSYEAMKCLFDYQHRL